MTIRRGSVLVLVLWTLFFLSALAIAVAARVDAGLKLASWCKTRTEAYCLAEAGVEKAIMEAMVNTNMLDTTAKSLADSEAAFRDVRLGGGTFSVYHLTHELGEGAATNYGVIDEESRINASKASSNLLASFAMTVGGVDSVTANELAGGIVDLRNRDDDVLTGGVGNNYYKGPSEPSSSHKGALQSVYELLLVKGMSPELFQRLEPHVTVYGSGKVNINTADSAVLASVASTCGGDSATCASLAQKIVVFRQEQGKGAGISSAGGGDIVAQIVRLADLSANEARLFSGMLPFLTLQSTCFRGIAEGRSSLSDAMHGEARMLGDVIRIEFVFDRAHGTKVFWYEN
jgi:general secretion pathway protein K